MNNNCDKCQALAKLLEGFPLCGQHAQDLRDECDQLEKNLKAANDKLEAQEASDIMGGISD